LKADGLVQTQVLALEEFSILSARFIAQSGRRLRL